MLFAILTLLYTLRTVESTDGLTSRNELQIREICVNDVNRIYKTNYDIYDAYDLTTSKEIAYLYLLYWGNQYEKKTGRKPTYEVYSRIWNGGPSGWKKKATIPYWNKVKKVLNENKRSL